MPEKRKDKNMERLEKEREINKKQIKCFKRKIFKNLINLGDSKKQLVDFYRK